MSGPHLARVRVREGAPPGRGTWAGGGSREIAAQESRRKERDKLTARIAKTHKPGTSKFYREVATAQGAGRS
jgi:hypothetical protein